MSAPTITRYPYTIRELDRTARELERLLAYALWAVTHRDMVDGFTNRDDDVC
jgi:hypothetical protein